MALKSALAEYRCRILKRPPGECSSNNPAGTGEPRFSIAPESSVPEVHPQKKLKGKKAAAKGKGGRAY